MNTTPGQPKHKTIRRWMLTGAATAALASLTAGTLVGQVTVDDAPTTAPATAPATTQAVEVERAVNYMIGMQIAEQLKSMDEQTGVVELDQVVKAITDTFNGVEPAYTQEQLQEALVEFQTQLVAKQEAERAAKLAENMAASTSFLEENAKREGVTTTESGLQFETLAAGEGASPVEGDEVKLHYRGTLADGTEFDSSRDPRRSGEPVTFLVQEGSLIEGFIEALKLMKVGGKYKVYIPPALGFGEMDTGDIPANSALIFEVEPIEVMKPEAEPTETTEPTTMPESDEPAPTTAPAE
jgi:FKBP-type peptidyl-prolyl cis-trans isomerase FkpA